MQDCPHCAKSPRSAVVRQFGEKCAREGARLDFWARPLLDVHRMNQCVSAILFGAAMMRAIVSSVLRRAPRPAPESIYA